MILLYLVVLVSSILISLGFILFVILQIISIFTSDAPFVPVPKAVEDEIVKNLELKSGSVLYDLGCGDGRVLIKAVQKHPGIRAVGVEVAFFPYLLAKFKTRKYKNIEIKQENIFQTDLSNATHIFLYLYPEVISRLFMRIREKCKPGTRVISCDFEAENYEPERITVIENTGQKRGRELFVYTI